MELATEKAIPRALKQRKCRYAIAAAALSTILLVIYLSSGHKRVYSTLTALGQSPSRFKGHQITPLQPYRPQPSTDKANEDTNLPSKLSHGEKILPDGSLRFHRDGNSDTSLLVLSLIQDESSWAKTFDFSRNRTEDDFLNLLSYQIDLSQTTLGFMTASSNVYERLKKATALRNLGRTFIIYRNDSLDHNDHDQTLSDVKKRYERQARLSINRNILMSRALRDETHIFWFDANVIDMTSRLMQNMMEKANMNPKEVGLMTARCDSIAVKDDDKSAWGLDRSVEGILLAVPEDRREHMSHRMMDTRRFVSQQTRGLKGDQSIRLDSLGSSSIYIRADLVRQGVNFPAFNIVGTTWGQDGWTAQETEGICYMAKRIAGADCWSLSEKHFTTHAS